METEIFVANTAREAIEMIRQQLGPEAVVLQVRKVPRKGVSGLLGGAQVEVTVRKPEVARPDPSTHIRLIQNELARRTPAPTSTPDPAPVTNRSIEPAIETPLQPRWQPEGVAPPTPKPRPNNRPKAARRAPASNESLDQTLLSALEGMALTRLCQHRLLEMLNRSQPGWKKDGLPAGIRGIRELLAEGWRSAPPIEELGQRHLFIGPAGVGKSALLGRRIVRCHLDEPETAVVAALDGTTSNSCPMLQYQCEALGVGFHRDIPAEEEVGGALLYYDTPGVDWHDTNAIEYWRARLDDLGRPCVHLVLNAAYDVALLTQQIRAFSPLGVTDVSFTHLDEERNPSKLWNIVLGGSCLVRWLAGGQKIPGTLEDAEAISLLPAQFHDRG